MAADQIGAKAAVSIARLYRRPYGLTVPLRPSPSLAFAFYARRDFLAQSTAGSRVETGEQDFVLPRRAARARVFASGGMAGGGLSQFFKFFGVVGGVGEVAHGGR